MFKIFLRLHVTQKASQLASLFFYPAAISGRTAKSCLHIFFLVLL